MPSTSVINVTVKVIETRQFKIRRWLAVRAIVFAAWVLGCGIKVHDD